MLLGNHKQINYILIIMFFVFFVSLYKCNKPKETLIHDQVLYKHPGMYWIKMNTETLELE